MVNWSSTSRFHQTITFDIMPNQPPKQPQPKKSSAGGIFDMIGLILFFVVYKFSPADVQVRYASITLIVVMLLQVAYYRYKKIKLPRYIVFINILALVFTIPAAIYNSLEFIKIKLLIIKTIMFIIPAAFTLFGKNFFEYFLGEMPGLEVLSKSEFNTVNLWYLVTSGLSLGASIWAYFYLNNDQFVAFKTYWLPVVSGLYLCPVIYFIAKKAKDDK